MLKRRKTVEVKYLLNSCNRALGRPKPDNFSNEEFSAYLKGICDTIEIALHATGNYNGFRYTDTEYLKEIRRNSSYRDWREYRRHYLD